MLKTSIENKMITADFLYIFSRTISCSKKIHKMRKSKSQDNMKKDIYFCEILLKCCISTKKE